MKKLSCVLFAIVSTTVALAQPGNGFTSLFDGKTLNGWKKITGSADYKIEDGAIVGITVPNSPNTFLVTEKEYGDFVLELEVKIEDTTSNSGIQFRSHYNPEMSNGRGGKGRVYGYQFELDPSSRAWTGGVYDEARRDWLYPLSLNPAAQSAFKTGEYNKVRVECIGNNIRTWVNGKACAYVVDTVDKSGFIALQVHAIPKPELAGEKIYWRNIRIKTTGLSPAPFAKGVYVANYIPNTLSPYEKTDGWKLLFDGKTTNGWKGAYKPGFPEKGWEVKDGNLTVLSSNGAESTNGGDIVTKEEYSAFDLSFDFKLTPGANSGVKYFVTLSENNAGSAIGLEYQVLDDTLHPDAKLGRNGNRTLASLYDLIKADKQKRFIHQPGQWNTGRVVVYPNNHVVHYLNGVKVLEYDRGSPAFRELVALSKYKVWKNFGEAPKGHILLQDHGNEVSFRSIKIKVLK
ncbi:hypothetical protein A3860_29815 [Niastella vici]|uniref:3-keto-alpha-glucoside-1,2-lyase/3-keto-2-hydroxy-glucal hydratase domain-containing protein n=1 Tax=Niastella vici TaxID=1703345 RepID=A0A1V9FUH9_9BACT|nr:DUF1080 domain-containing protein [Niastella vici]OQP62029.1 hypothetical protein A3860_29815 [Niastella vici]